MQLTLKKVRLFIMDPIPVFAMPAVTAGDRTTRAPDPSLLFRHSLNIDISGRKSLAIRVLWVETPKKLRDA
jgi:hypothetical protein